MTTIDQLSPSDISRYQRIRELYHRIWVPAKVVRGYASVRDGTCFRFGIQQWDISNATNGDELVEYFYELTQFSEAHPVPFSEQLFTDMCFPNETLIFNQINPRDFEFRRSPEIAAMLGVS